uniref:Uncharacterized protein n=1 Tax=viral metagenome TaxID=1070528 RepID=A0A6C0HIW3_9ZZZZ
MSLSDFDAFFMKVDQLKEDYRVLSIKAKLLLEKTIEFHHFGGLSFMDTEEDAFWRRVSSDMFSSAIKHFSWNIETEGVEGVLEERNY